MRTAFLFPGQGSQRPGMGRSFYEEWSTVESTLATLDDRADVELLELMLGGTADALRRTKNTQLSVYSIGVAVADAVVERYGVSPDYVAGHSLGHYTAAAHARLFDPTNGVKLVGQRGQAMGDAARAAGPSSMLAVLFAPPDTIDAVCAEIDGVTVAARNTEKQTVISGYRDAVSEARSAIADRARARFTELDVDAAFHSPVMNEAVEPVATALDTTDMQRASTPIISDVTGDGYEDPNTARSDLTDQVTATVNWTGVIRTMQTLEVDRYVEFPPARTLSKFVSRLDPDADVVTLESPDDAASAFSAEEVPS